jgi:hypothetical protein
MPRKAPWEREIRRDGRTPAGADRARRHRGIAAKPEGGGEQRVDCVLGPCHDHHLGDLATELQAQADRAQRVEGDRAVVAPLLIPGHEDTETAGTAEEEAATDHAREDQHPPGGLQIGPQRLVVRMDRHLTDDPAGVVDHLLGIGLPAQQLRLGNSREGPKNQQNHGREYFHLDAPGDCARTRQRDPGGMNGG